MKKVQRIDTKKDSLKVLAKSGYYFLALPCLVFLAAASVIIYSNNEPGGHDPAMGGFFVLVWFALVVPLAVRRYGKVTRRNSLKKMVSLLSRADRFNPDEKHQLLDAGQGKYLGIDTEHGTLLYIHIVKKGLIDVVGLDMNSWTNRELEGGTLRLYTRQPEMPVLSVNAHPTAAKVMFDTLGAMSHNTYTTAQKEPWPLFVSQQSRFVEYENNAVVPQAI